VSIGDLLRHTRLGGVERLSQYFGAINQAFQAIRNDPEAMLFGFDQEGHVYIHEATCRSIRQLWQEISAAPAPGAETIGNGPMPAAFTPPHLGPSETVAPHQPSADGGARP
jgi:hypothetical protein